MFKSYYLNLLLDKIHNRSVGRYWSIVLYSITLNSVCDLEVDLELSCYTYINASEDIYLLNTSTQMDTVKTWVGVRDWSKILFSQAPPKSVTLRSRS